MGVRELERVTKELGGFYITYNPLLALELGLPAAVILGKFLYWTHNSANRSDGYFFKTESQLKLETGVKREAQKLAIKKLREAKLLEPPKYDFKHRRMFKINKEELDKLVWIMRKKHRLDSLNTADEIAENQPTIKKKKREEVKSNSNLLSKNKFFLQDDKLSKVENFLNLHPNRKPGPLTDEEIELVFNQST